MISSHPEWTDYKEAPIKGGMLKRWMKSRFRYVDYPFLLSHRGFGNHRQFVIQGHVFRGMALSKPRQRYTPWKNFIALIKMFLVRTVPRARVELLFNGERYQVSCDEGGFFEFVVQEHRLEAGWHQVEIRLLDALVEGQEEVNVDSELLITGGFEYGCISDIDDTFLVSHITRSWRKLYLLITKDPKSRRPFKGVVDFYKALYKGRGARHNPFFYVSSSEWNLYDFLIRFTRFHKLPKGVLQLKDIKQGFMDFFRSGPGTHDHKRLKIERILAMYPERQFILLGDNGQHDPYIYHHIAQKYPGRIKAIYIRAVKRSHRKEVNRLLGEIEQLEIPSLQFKRSAQAVEHARQHGFID